MSEPLVDGFSPENIARIYRGQPALADGQAPVDVLKENTFEMLGLSATGLTHKEVMGVMEDPRATTVLNRIQAGRNSLGILDTFQLAGYFPLEAEDEAVGAKRLARLEAVPAALDILEALSVGKRNKEVAKASGISGPAVRERLGSVERLWKEDGLMSLRIANAVRARYIRAIEERSGTIDTQNIGRFTLPRLAKVEPNLLNSYPNLKTAAAA